MIYTSYRLVDISNIQFGFDIIRDIKTAIDCYKVIKQHWNKVKLWVCLPYYFPRLTYLIYRLYKLQNDAEMAKLLTKIEEEKQRETDH